MRQLKPLCDVASCHTLGTPLNKQSENFEAVLLSESRQPGESATCVHTSRHIEIEAARQGWALQMPAKGHRRTSSVATANCSVIESRHPTSLRIPSRSDYYAGAGAMPAPQPRDLARTGLRRRRGWFAQFFQRVSDYERSALERQTAMIKATIMSDQPVSVPNTPSAANRTARFPTTSLRAHIQAERILASPAL